MTELRVRVEDAQGAVSEHRLDASLPCWIGRERGCAIVLPSDAISRRHVCIEHAAGQWRARDASANGTWIDYEKITLQTRAFAPPISLQVGPYRLQLSAAATPANDAPLSATDAPVALRKRIHRLVIDRLDLVRLDRAKMSADVLLPEVKKALQEICDGLGEELPDKAVRARLVTELCDEVLGLGPLEGLLADPAVSEIMVVDAETIFAERAGRIARTPLRFTDDDAVRAVIERIVTPLGRRIDESTPLVDARLADGSRVNAVIPPLARRGPCITIRKFSGAPISIDKLVEIGSLDRRIARFLTRGVRARRNIVVSGGTGSGKTTLLNVLSAAVPAHERIVTIEDAAELRLDQPHVVALEARPPNLEGRGEVTIRDLVKNALRMRPDRIVVGECRGGEAIDMLQAMNTGHEGSMTTTHANSPKEAIARLETLCLMAGLDLPLRAIRAQLATSIHLIVQQTRYADGSRRVSCISEVRGIDEAGELQLSDIFCFEPFAAAGERVHGEFRATGYLPACIDSFVQLGLVDDGAFL